MYDQLYGRTGLIAILGSGFLWAWYDALFMGSLATGAARSDFMAELVAILMFAFGALWASVLLFGARRFHGLVESARSALGTGVVGTVGSLAVVCAAATGSVPLLVAGCAAGGFFLAFGTIGWGAVYAQGGTITATPYVAGAFAAAFVLDIPLFFMVPGAASVFYAAYPVVSMALFLAVPAQDRSYSSVLDESAPLAAPLSGRERGGLGVPMAIGVGYALVMTGFGFFQHLISFSSVASNGVVAYGGVVQAARGGVAVVLFGLILASPHNSKRIYRVGLPLMIAGCMVVPFFFGSELFPFPAAVIIAGYTAFDLFMWVTFSSIACTQSRSPLRTICLMRVVCSVCYAAGALLGIALVGFDQPPVAQMQASVSFAGYLIVIAVVVLLGSEEVFALTTGYFDYRRTAEAARAANAAAEGDDLAEGDDPAELDDLDWMARRFEALGLTAREAEVARLLTHGRTQKWIADYLCISENTVGTHLRRIYQKACVHNRQQFLDVLAAGDRE